MGKRNKRKMKRKITLVILIIIIFKLCNCQTLINQTIEYPILEIKNKSLDSILHKVIDFESYYCELKPDICYFVVCKIIDSTKFNLEIQIRSIKEELVLSNDLAYGIYLVNNHVFFIHKSMDYFFITTINNKLFAIYNKKALNSDFIEIIVDGYETNWEFNFENKIFIFKNYSTHNFIQTKYKDPFNIKLIPKEIYEIDIINDEPSELPK
jgi:hypothetical protein